MRRARRSPVFSPGFSLLEVLFATTILTVAVVSLAHVIALAARANLAARTNALASVLAAQKAEQLRALAWTFDAAGAPVSDTTTGGAGLSPSPPDALMHSVDGYTDLLDAAGNNVLAESAAVFVRRWAVTPLASNVDILVIQISVARTGIPSPIGARLLVVRTRKGHHDDGF